MDEQVRKFLDYLKKTRRLSTNTIVSYQRDLGQASAYFKQQEVTSWEQVDQYLLLALLSELRQQKKANSTINRMISSLRQFYKFMIRHHYLTVNPMEMIDHQYAMSEPAAPVILTEKEIEQLIAVPDTTTKLGIRDRALLELLDATGMRVTEVINLTRDALHLDVSLLRLGGSNGPERMIPLSQPAVEWLTRYLNDARPHLVKPDQPVETVFVNAHGRALTRQGIWKKMKEWVKAAKIDKDVTPQTIRYSFAVHLLENGADAQLIQEILGRNAMQAIRPYVQVTPQQLAASYRKYHPRA